MINNVVLVGRVVDEPKLVIFESGYKLVNFVLAIQKPFRNSQNEYETDFVPIQAWTGLADLIHEYVGKGSVIGCKCRVSTRTVEIKETRYKAVEIIAEKVSFITLQGRKSKKDLDKADIDIMPEIDLTEQEFDQTEQIIVEEKTTKKTKKD